jgi:putative ATP-binding cassette transporter
LLPATAYEALAARLADSRILMTLTEFLRRESNVPISRVLAIAAISGASNAILLMVINSAANVVNVEAISARLFVMFVVAIALYVLTQRYILRLSSVEIEKIISKVRIGIAGKIRAADLEGIERIGRAQIYASVNTHTMTLSQATTPMVLACQSTLLVAFSAIYVFILSKAAFFLTAAIVAAGILVHLRHKKQLMIELERSTVAEHQLFSEFTDLLEGFKEVKLSARRSGDLYTDLASTATEVATLKAQTANRYADLHIFTQVLFYLLLGAIVFILPSFSRVHAEQVTRVSAAILFIIGPLSLIVGVFPMFRRANHALDHIARLEAQLDLALPGPSATTLDEAPSPPPFERIDLVNVTFSYQERGEGSEFTIGPVNLTIARGDVIFIVGGNGSGKSTLLKVLSGLYQPSSGLIYVDDVPVSTVGYAAFRELFAAIFSDYHLFNRPYGLRDVTDRIVVDQLREVDLLKKNVWRMGRFEHQGLSTGQRKRLALIVSRLEQKPIQIFDEWAADQDPQFREFFYASFLEELRGDGKTIIAATHDDRYFDKADRIVKMDEGKVVFQERKGTSR